MCTKQLRNDDIITRCKVGKETYEAIGNDYGLSKQRIYQICCEAKVKKKPLHNKAKRKRCKRAECNKLRIKGKFYCSDECKGQALGDPSKPGSKFRIEKITCTHCTNIFERTGRYQQLLTTVKINRGYNVDHNFCCTKCYQTWRKMQ